MSGSGITLSKASLTVGGVNGATLQINVTSLSDGSYTIVFNSDDGAGLVLNRTISVPAITGIQSGPVPIIF